MKDFLHHLFVPRFSNNHRAKLLHHKSLLIAVVFLFIGTFLFSFFKTNYPQVLGVAYDISSQELLILTNHKRQEKGLSVLTLNDSLSQAAHLKAKDMFAKNYWAHNSPAGETPWVFIKSTGYEYTYAGENLARGFTNSEDVVDAWMESQSHRENMLSSNYRDIGFAIVTGKINGEETVLVVEMFGNTTSPFLSRGTQAARPVIQKEAATTQQSSIGIQKGLVAAFRSEPLIDSFSTSRNIALMVTFSFILALFFDMVLAKRKKVVRVVGHNADHVLFLLAITAIIVVISRGIVL